MTTANRMAQLEQTRVRKSVLAFLALGLCAIGGFTVLAVLDPAQSGLFPPCPFHALTGLHCPGCGSLRAIQQFLQGHLAQAVRLNAIAVVSLPFIGVLFLRDAPVLARLRGRPARRLHPAVSWVTLVVVLLYWVLRNVPSFPFSLLAPH